ncbi:MAG: thiol oxidoreductase, partial [Mesorhizobium sp.]
MRRRLDYLRRLRRAEDCGLPSQHNPRYGWLRRLSPAVVVALTASALAGAPEPAGLATSRADLTPKDLARVIAIARP